MIDFEQLSTGELYVEGRRTRPGLSESQDVQGIMTPVDGTPGAFLFRYNKAQIWEQQGTAEVLTIPSDLRPGDRLATFPEGDDLGLREKDVFRIVGVTVANDTEHYEAKLVSWTESDSVDARPA